MADASWAEYLHAAKRKLEMAEHFHLAGLKKALDRSPSPNPLGEPDRTAEPPLDVQAHFEGLLYCVWAACDQGLGALRHAYDLAEETGGKELVARLAEEDPTLAADLTQWWSDPLVQEAHRVRNLAIHHFTGKSLGGSGWQIDPPSEYNTPHPRRELIAYSTDVLERAAILGTLLHRLDAFLERLCDY